MIYDILTCRLAELRICALADLRTCRLADLRTCGPALASASQPPTFVGEIDELLATFGSAFH